MTKHGRYSNCIFYLDPATYCFQLLLPTSAVNNALLLIVFTVLRLLPIVFTLLFVMVFFNGVKNRLCPYCWRLQKSQLQAEHSNNALMPTALRLHWTVFAVPVKGFVHIDHYRMCFHYLLPMLTISDYCVVGDCWSLCLQFQLQFENRLFFYSGRKWQHLWRLC
jgi:hypothetical protein